MPSSDIINDLVKSLDRACRSLGFSGYMPDAMIGHFVRQVVPASFSDNQLDLTQFYQWVRQEYSVPDHVFSRVFSKINEDAFEMGITVVQPDSFNPEFGETVKEWMKYELKEVVYSDLKEEMRKEVRDELYKELRPEVYSEVRSWMESEGKAGPRLDDKLLDALEEGDRSEKSASQQVPEEVDITGMVVGPGPSEEDIRRELNEKLRPEVEDDLYKELRPLLDKKIREELEKELRPQLRNSFDESVREELRRELWDVVREEVKEDLSTVLTPVLEGELRKELLEEQRVEGLSFGDSGGGNLEDAGPPLETTSYAGDMEEAGEGETEPERPGLEFRVDDQLNIIRKIRERLVPEIRDKLFAQISELARDLEQKERIKRHEELLSDPRYCLEKIREFLFPDQPGLWKKVAPLIEPEEWGAVVLAMGEEASPFDMEKLDRSRGVIREALKLKSEIEEEINYTPRNMESAGGKSHSRTIKKVLAGADEVLDFALKSISDILDEATPAEAAGQQ